jgi:hypothetical protein
LPDETAAWAERHLQREAAALGLKLSVNDADDSKPH